MGPLNKKRKLNKESDEEMDDDSNHKKARKQPKRRRRNKLANKYKDDEDIQSLQTPLLEPSKANEFFDPITHCRINLDDESCINPKTKEYIQNFELLDRKNISIKEQIENYLKTTANCSGYTIQKGISSLFCLGL